MRYHDIPKPREPHPNCICFKPLAISIPAGGHIHLQCPVHGDKIIYGPHITY